MNNLVIVESPTKSKTLQKFLGSGYRVEASMGHIRDLPKSDFGVDTENDFEPKYIIPRDKKKRVNELKKTAQNAKTIWLATDPDREGEAIAWHISELISNPEAQNSKSRPNIHRVVFHEITEEAIKQAFDYPRSINIKLVDAQQARRVLDRLVGYKLSPLLWKKVKRGLSAGRVQSVALRLIVEREKEIIAFKTEEYWTIEALLEKQDKSASFYAEVLEKDGKKITISNQSQAEGHAEELKKLDYQIEKVTQKQVKRYPYPPFTTSTLQQTAAFKLGMSAKKTMSIAQALYERGFITYMRTDSVNLSVSAVSAARKYIGQEIGSKYLPASPRVYKSKSKNAQEAHEAVRPTNVGFKSEQLKSVEGITRDHLRLYELIWKRFVACQMSEAILDQTSVDVTAGSYKLRASGSVIKFEGWLKIFGKDAQDVSEDTTEEKKSKSQVLPSLSDGEMVDLEQITPQQHFTQPPPRYSEATLIKKLEELGIGRPSTYAPILSTIVERFYVEKEKKKLIPTNLGMTVTEFLLEYFSDIVDYSFTAQMEDNLDDIAKGERQWKPIIREFFTPFEKKIEQTSEVAQKVQMEIEHTGRMCPKCGKELIVRIGRFGKFLACSGFPECKHTESVEEKVNVKCPDCGGEIIIRKTKRGKTFYGCKNWPGCKFASWTKPK
ncbi:type I DNA topoisomerase [Candidatus Daviesbacteria bacterium]|nr:type I DNA topoisomerase [Candidatus Daviesbacteria bacterium]